MAHRPHKDETWSQGKTRAMSVSVHCATVLGTLAGPQEVILTVPGSLERLLKPHC